MEYAISLAILHGVLKLADFQPEAIGNPAVRAWLPRIKMTMKPVDDPLPTADNGREPAQVIVNTKDGRSFEAFNQRARGVLQNPLSDDEMWAKFDDCVAGVMDAGRAAEVRACLETFETLDNVGDMMGLFSAPS
jgi:2-methylcitrate dehydratase PrpD